MEILKAIGIFVFLFLMHMVIVIPCFTDVDDKGIPFTLIFIAIWCGILTYAGFAG